MKQLVEERAAAKKAKDFARADALRAKITELGWNVMDTAKGPQLTTLYLLLHNHGKTKELETGKHLPLLPVPYFIAAANTLHYLESLE